MLLAVSFFMAGRFAVKRLETRVICLEKIYVLFSEIGSRIQYTADTAADIFSSLDGSGNYSVLPFVSECKCRLLEGETFDSAWNRSVNGCENSLPLKKTDMGILESFGSGFGTTDISGQVSNCEIHKKLVNEKIASARRECDLYSKPVGGIGILAGIAVMILSI